MAASGESICDQEKELDRVKQLIRIIPDYPKPGRLFKDICPILKDPSALKTVTKIITGHIKKNIGKIDVVAGLETRGFLFGPQVAMNLNVAFVPIRRPGKLPGPTFKAAYGEDHAYEVQQDAFTPGQKVVIIDDLIGTGGALVAACNLVKSCNCEVIQCIVLVELEDLNEKEVLPSPCHVLVKF